MDGEIKGTLTDQSINTETDKLLTILSTKSSIRLSTITHHLGRKVGLLKRTFQKS